MRIRVGIASAIIAAACGGSSPTSYGSGNPPPPPPPPPPSGGGSASVTIADFSYAPASLSVKVGTTVRWSNTGSTAHTVNPDGGTFTSGNLAGSAPDPYGGTTPGQTFQFTFNTAGTYAYHCAYHSALYNMKGTITVTQ